MKEKITASLLVICLLMSYLVTLSNIYVIYASSEENQVVFEAEIVRLDEDTNTVENKGTEENKEGEKTENTGENSSTTNETDESTLNGTSENTVVPEETNENNSEGNVTNVTSNQTVEARAGETLIAENPESKEEKSGYALKLKVGVKNDGYLKNPKITIDDLDNQIFTIKEISNPIIQSFKNGVIKLNNIDAKDEYELEIPLEIKKDTEVNVDVLKNGTKVKLSGTYVDENANEEKVEREVTSFISIENERNIGIGSNIEKYITYTQDGKEYAMIQIKVEVTEGNENLILPIKSTDLKIKLPEINVEEGQEKPEIVNTNVMAYNTGFTNGRLGSEVEFTEENIKLEEDGRLNIHVDNKGQDGKYRNVNGKDEYLIELNYNNAQNIKTREVKSEIEAKIEVFNGKDTKEETGTLEQVYKFDEAVTSKITYEVRNLTESLGKGKIYANVNKTEDFYETEYQTEVALNISRANSIKVIEINESEENYVTEDGSIYSTTTEAGLDTYYKNTTFKKENLDKIIGENGTLDILNNNGEVLITIDKTVEANEEGNIVLGYPNKIGKIIIRVNNPENSGILSFQNTKAIGKSNYTKESLMAFKGLSSKYVAAALYDEEIKTELGVKETKTVFTETRTKANLEVSRDTLSTIVKNEDVQFNINLNNATEESDMYVNPEFEITLPKGITSATIQEINLLYGNDELKIAASESRLNEENRVVIYIKLEGAQKTFSTGEGATIVVKTNIELDTYLSNRKEKVELKYINPNATRYESTLVDGIGADSLEINYAGATGVVNAQRITGYNGTDSIMSMNQGDRTVIIADDSESKIATEELIVINNSDEVLETPLILGRISFEGNKDLSNDSDLHSNVNTKIVSGIEKVSGKDVKVYYSENENATRDLNNQENGWKESVESFDNVKSYLIVPNGNIEKGESLVLKYSFEIPAKLGLGRSIYGTFGTYFNSGVVTKLAEAPKVGLLTEAKTEEPVSTNENVQSTEENTEVEDLFVLEDGYKITVSQGYREILGKTEDNTEETEERVYVQEEAKQRKITQIKFEESEDNKETILNKGANYKFKIRVYNLKQYSLEEPQITMVLPEGINYVSASYDSDYTVEGDQVNYNLNNKTVTWNCPGIGDYVDLVLEFGVNRNTNIKETELVLNVNSDELDRTYSYSKKYEVGNSVFEANYRNTSGNNYVNIGDEVEYRLTLKNTSGKTVQNIKVDSEFPEEIKVYSVDLVKGDYKTNGTTTDNKIHVSQYLKAGESFDVIVKATIGKVTKETKLTNYMTVTTDDGSYNTESVNTIIQTPVEETSGNTATRAQSANTSNENLNTEEVNVNSDMYERITGEFKITGVAWADLNANGSKDENEKGIGNIIVKLYDATTNNLEKQVTTDEAGNYVISGVRNGKYYAIYEYNMDKYSLSDYHKQGVSEDKNSDVILSNGQARTDTISISNSSLSNIDIGLIDGTVFDLMLEKSIVQITVQNDNGTKVVDGKGETLAKAEIQPKDLASSTVYVEYKIKVTNNGQIPGTADKIVDYLPKDMTVNTELNPDWYIGSDGNAYNESLSNVIIEPKETKEITLIVTKEMTEENTGISSNKAEIAAASNEFGIADIDSTPGNGATNEDDLGQADAIISITTGGGVVNIMIIGTVLLNLLLLGFIVKRRVDREREVIF